MSTDKNLKTSQQVVEHPHNAPSESASARILSSDDSLIADLMKEQPTADQISQMRVRERKIPNLLEIPEECVPLQGKKYRFVWLTKGKDLSVKLRTNGWVLCNRMTAPFIKEHRFGAHGGVEQAGMLLAFLPEEVALNMELGAAKISQQRVKHYTQDIFKQQDKDAPAQFYKPVDDDKD